MFRTVMFGSLAAFLLGLAGCNRYIEETTNPTEQYLSDSNSVGYDIQSVSAPQNSYVWIATYTAQGKTGRFRIELGASQPLDDKESKQFDIQSGHGKLVAEPGSDASILLTDLKKAPEAKTLPTKVQRARSPSLALGHTSRKLPAAVSTPTPPPAIGQRRRFSSVKETRKAQSEPSLEERTILDKRSRIRRYCGRASCRSFVTSHKNRSEPILAERLALFTSSESALRSIQLRRRKIKIAKTPVSPERTGAQRTTTATAKTRPPQKAAATQSKTIRRAGRSGLRKYLRESYHLR
jgi:hypothetical protein